MKSECRKCRAAGPALVAALMLLRALALAAGEPQAAAAATSGELRQVASSKPGNASAAAAAAGDSGQLQAARNATGERQEDARLDCPAACSNGEFLSILNKISLNVDILRDFQRAESGARSSGGQEASRSGNQAPPPVRPECVRQLIQMIKNLASGELEMKTLLEFASSTAPINLRGDLSYLRASYLEGELERRRRQQPGAGGGGGGEPPLPAECQRQRLLQQQQQQAEQQDYYLLGDEPSQQAADGADKAHFLPKLVASVDQWLDTIERFTVTREWAALMRVFNGAESILTMFANATTAPQKPAPASTAASGAAAAKTPLAGLQKNLAAGLSNELVERLERELPGEVQALTSSLNRLFPWHVWPWNNIDLYSTIDTFLNHGIFAFSKTTAGPERRIDYLPQMLETLFKSLKHDSFPKRCHDWSRQICDLELFYDRLGLAPAPDNPEASGEAATKSNETAAAAAAAASARKAQVAALMGDNRNKLTQELVCIMFSSLSMQQFGAKDVDLKAFDQLDAEQLAGARHQGDKQQLAGAELSMLSQQQAQLKWSKQIRKALRLYKLSREALTDEQWAALYKQLNELWNQMKISDRVIMVGRIVQLLTNCHMPREILESALWKDIYKYKNALNQISDIVIEELNRSSENGQFTLKQLAIGSKHLEDILTRFVRLLPRLIESLSLTLTDQLPELVGKFFDEKIAFFKGPCKGHSFSELVPSLAKHRAEILELERLVCQQLRTKPSLTMSQINNLTNDFLAMAFNFTTFGASFQSLPRFWASGAQAQAQAGGGGGLEQLAASKQLVGFTQQAASAAGAALVAATRQNLNLLVSASGGGAASGLLSANASLASAPSLALGAALLAARRPDEAGGASAEQQQAPGSNGTSIIDELAANPRLAQIVAILQSSALDPPEVHAELPELDWVEAGTSVALLYETVQKLLSFEGLFVVFPEVSNFQDELRARAETSKRMFTKFSKKDPAMLAAYSLDTLMPVALRTFQPLDSFHAECFATFRDLFGETSEFVEASGGGGGATGATGAKQQQAAAAREARQWQCAVSATNFASYALNQLVSTFNSMLRNILNQMSRQRDLYKFKQAPSSQPAAASGGLNGTSTTTTTTNATCVLFDGSIATLVDNLPQLVDLGLETVLIASTTTTGQRLTLKETLCSFENTLDPLADHAYLGKQFKLREAICHLLHESSLSTCANALKANLWTSTMRELNSTWFEVAAVGVEPSFRGILRGVHEFLELFGKVKPSSMSDGLIARALNFNSYWTGLVNKAVSSVEKYREKRFQLALQILMPIIYDNLPIYNDNTNSTMDETKLALKSSILSARAILSYLSRPEPLESAQAPAAPATLQDQIDGQLRALFDWADRHSLAISETLIRTLATNLAKFERLLGAPEASSAAAADGHSANQTWARFCAAPLDAYLELEPLPLDNKAALVAGGARQAELTSAKDAICKFEWALLRARLFQQANLTTVVVAPAATNSSAPQQNASSTSIEQYSTRQLIRVSLTKWGQVLDLVFASISGGGGAQGARKAARPLPKFLALAHWQPLQAKLSQLAPGQDDPTNFIWIWRALERLVDAADQANRRQRATLDEMQPQQQQLQPSASAEALTRIFEQLNCALDAVKGGITWDNMVNIYQDRQDVLAAHATLNNGIALASASANTFLAHKKFQKFLNNFVRPRAGLGAFCEMRDRARLESIFAPAAPASGGAGGGQLAQERSADELAEALESFQEFLCDTNLETFVQNINPISICYHQPAAATSLKVGSNATAAAATTTPAPPSQQQQPAQLADTIERFFKLASLAALDAKLADTSQAAKPAILDKQQWEQLRLWWLNQTEAHQGNSGLALTLVRLLQTLDSINAEHVVWRAIFRSIHELSEVSAYLVRAAEMERQATREQRERGQPTKLALIREAAEQVDSAMKAGGGVGSGGALDAKATPLAAHQTAAGLKLGHKQQQLASTMANVMFPEVSNFISLKTFKQLRYIKSISDYFASAPGAQESLCRNLTARRQVGATNKVATPAQNSSAAAPEDDDDDDEEIANFTTTSKQQQQQRSKFELIDYKLNSSARLYALLCHYQSPQWLTAMNIVLSSKTSSLSKKVNYMTKYLLIFTKHFEHNTNLQSFIHGQQLENIESVANTTVSYLIALTQPFRTLTLSKISNISWHSIPSLLDSIDRHLCASKSEHQTNGGGGEPKPAGANSGQQQQHASVVQASQQQQQQQLQLAVYEPKKPDIETLICKLPSWNITQVYSYISENIDLQNMISLATQNNHTASLFGDLTTAASRNQTAGGKQAKLAAGCITPFKFASKWLKIAQDLIDETMSKASRDKIRKCLSANKRGQSVYVQSTRYVKLLNSLLATLNDLTLNNSWPLVRRTWNSISFAILSQSGQAPAVGASAGPAVAAPATTSGL